MKNTNIPETNIDVRSGLVLVASPFVTNKAMAKTVVMVTKVTNDMVTGLIVNKPQQPVDKQFNNYRFPVFYGGPTNYDNVSYLIGTGEDDNSTNNQNLLWSSDSSTLEHVLKYKRYSSFSFLFFFTGLVTWPFEQLRTELLANDWFIGNKSASVLLSNHQDIVWDEFVLEHGSFSAPLIEIDRESVFN